MNSSNLGPGSEASSWPTMRSQKMSVSHRYLELPATCACTRVACGQATAHMAVIRVTLFCKRPPYGTCRRRCLTATCNSQHAIALASFIVMCDWRVRGSASTARGGGKYEDAFATPGLLSRHQHGSIFAISGAKIEANFRPQY
jgi:hypothetical protein